jgi:hypothetical protein
VAIQILPGYAEFLMGFEWIAIRMQMEHPGSAIRLVCGVKREA